MQEQQITWGWALRILWGVLWRWLAVATGAIFGLATIAVTARRMGGPDLRHNPVMPQIVIVLWVLASVWAFVAALRARHGEYRLVLVSTEDGVQAFD
jgi:hypothetical protein